MVTFDLRESAGIRLIIISGLTLALLAPMMMIRALIAERENRRSEAVAEVTRKWGGKQVVSGPVLSIPYLTPPVSESSNNGHVTSYAHFLPENLEIAGGITPEVRYRGIYEVVLYTAELTMKGVFPSLDVVDLAPNAKEVLWENALVSVGISDLWGVRNAITVYLNEVPHEADSTSVNNDSPVMGVRAKVELDPAASSHDFSITLNFAGSTDLMFSPLGKVTDVRLESSWPDPSFVGEFLPSDRNICGEGFSAEWHILNLSHNRPQKWTGRSQQITGSEFGVELVKLVNEYQQTTRASKYAIMFIILTFLAFFMTEVLNRKAIHPVQYLFVGLGLVLFYSLLISLSEQMTFGLAYLIASAMMVILIAVYTRSALGSAALGMIMGGILALLYAFMYIVLQQHDYALLLGSLGLFVILALVMHLTRRVDWFTVLAGPDSEEKGVGDDS